MSLIKNPTPLELDKLLNIFIDLERQAIGIRFIFTEEEFKTIDLNTPKGTMTYCTAVRNASRGKGVKLKKDNFACMAAAMALGIIESNQEFESGYRNKNMGLYRDLTLSRQVAKDMVFCHHRIYGVEIKPLDTYLTSKPDIVIIITQPYNIMRISQGYAYNLGYLNNIHIGGMNAICQELTSYVHEKNQANISMMCSGTRAVCQWKDEELGFGIPFNQLQILIDGIINTSNLMDDNSHKKLISQKIDKEKNIEYKVQLNTNYYRGVYRTKKDLKK